MHLQILGGHQVESAEGRATAFLIDQTIAIDAGGLAGGLTLAEQARIEAVLVTHYHFDHVTDLPFLGLLWKAPWGDARSILTSDSSLTALRLSLWCSCWATAVAVVLGVPLAWLLARVPFPGRGLVRALCTLSMVLPPVVAGVALFYALAVLTSATSFLTLRSRHPDDRHVLAVMVLSNLTLASTATLFGALFLTPAAMAVKRNTASVPVPDAPSAAPMRDKPTTISPPPPVSLARNTVFTPPPSLRSGPSVAGGTYCSTAGS